MRISFDIDDTLVCAGHGQKEPALAWWLRWLYPERLRLGTKSLFDELRRDGHSVWIYTTSYRSCRYLKNWFRCHGIHIDGVVNQFQHEKVVGRQGPSKFPPAFNIDLHIDDAEGVLLEGMKHGFSVLRIFPDDLKWADAVRNAVRWELR